MTLRGPPLQPGHEPVASIRGARAGRLDAKPSVIGTRSGHPSEAPEVVPTRLIGGHTIEAQPLRSGGSATVHRVVDETEGEGPSLLKLAKQEHYSDYFADEVSNLRAARRLGLNAPLVWDAGVHTGRPHGPNLAFIKMSDQGTGLQELGPMPDELIAELASSMVTSLRPAHEAGYVHNDPSLENFVMAPPPGLEVPTVAQTKAISPIDFGMFEHEPARVDEDIEMIMESAASLSDLPFRPKGMSTLRFDEAVARLKDPALREVFERVREGRYVNDRQGLLNDLQPFTREGF